MLMHIIEAIGIKEPAGVIPSIKKAGFDACMDKKHDNPYPKGSSEHKSWEFGQREAFDEHARYY